MNIFDLFPTGSTSYSENDYIIDYEEHPYLVLISVSRGIEQFTMMKDIMEKKYQGDWHSFEKMYINKIYGMLKKYDQNDPESLEDAFRVDWDELENALLYMRNFFEDLEEYEKCQIIQEKYVALKDNIEIDIY